LSKSGPLDTDNAEISLAVEFQACDDAPCMLPPKRTISITLPLEEVDVPALPTHMAHGEREGSVNDAAHAYVC